MLQEIITFYKSIPFFSPDYIFLLLAHFVVNLVTLLTAVRAVNIKTKLFIQIYICLLMTVVSIIVRFFMNPPYTMLVVHLSAVLLLWVFYRTSFFRSFIGVFFSMILMAMSTVLINFNLVLLSKIKTTNLSLYILMASTEVFFNIFYIALTYKYPHLNLAFIFEENNEEKDVKV